MAQKYAFKIDPSRCTFCRACVAACKMENNVGVQWSRNDMILIGPDQTKDPAMYPVFMNCQQCEHPACVAACPAKGKAIKKREDGIVLIDTEHCVGDELCVYACPYGALRLTPVKNSHGYFTVDKCTFCAHKLDRPADAPGGNRPACAMACPTNAIEFGPRDRILDEVKRERREPFELNLFGLGPSSVFLKPLPRRAAWDKL